MDLTPYAKQRDAAIKNYCDLNGIACTSHQDYTLHGMDDVRTKTGNVYQVFTPFFRACQSESVMKPAGLLKDVGKLRFVESVDGCLTDEQVDKYAAPHAPLVDLYGGRDRGLEILSRIRQGDFRKYEDERNDAHAQKTTVLAAYLKFGCVSVREAFDAILAGSKRDSVLMSQLYWREFFFQLVYHKPQLLSAQISDMPNRALKERMNSVRWKPGQGKEWDAWCQGKTGFPFVDAGMRQMNQTGYMHNRVRMVVAMFLTKNLHIDWRDGERYFATKLIDYDPCQNNGGWQWSASTGVDTQPYRIFNCWTQTTRYDPQCEYVKKWVEELRDVPVTDVLRWEKVDVRTKYVSKGIYLHPIVDHAETAALGKMMLKGEDVPW